MENKILTPLIIDRYMLQGNEQLLNKVTTGGKFSLVAVCQGCFTILTRNGLQTFVKALNISFKNNAGFCNEVFYLQMVTLYNTLRLSKYGYCQFVGCEFKFWQEELIAFHLF